jgi:hypothetical protein
VENKKTFEGFWGWYGSLVYLSGENLLQMEQVAQKSLVEVFNFLTYMKDLTNLREKELQKQLKGL